MKLEKSDRIISNADYERLVGLAELHEKAIREVVTETIHLKVFEIYTIVNRIQNTHRSIINNNHRCHEVAEKVISINNDLGNIYAEMVTLKNRIIQEKNAEIARLKQPWWKRVF